MVFSFFRSQTLNVFARLKVADAIAEGRDPGVNQRFLKAAAGIGLLRSLDGGGFALSPVGEMLRSGPGSMRDFAAVVISGGHFKAWENLEYSARTEGNAFVHTFGQDVWEYFTKTQPEEGALFNGAMQSMSENMVPVILDAYQLPTTGLVVDVGGGVGSMLCAFLKAQPGLRGIVMDLPFTEAAGNAYIAAQGLSDRCSFVGGSFFESVPAGGDLYTMKFILHDWSDEKSLAILRTIHAAMPAHAKLALFEAVVPDDDALAGPARMMDLNMMVMCGGKERTAGEWSALLDAAGFKLDRIIPTATFNSVVEASKK
jgi:hypothetical protein